MDRSLANAGFAALDLFKAISIINGICVDDKHTQRHRLWQLGVYFVSQRGRFQMWAACTRLFVIGHGSLDYETRDAENSRSEFQRNLLYLNQLLDEIHMACKGDPNFLKPSYVLVDEELDGYFERHSRFTEEGKLDPVWCLYRMEFIINELFILTNFIDLPSYQIESAAADLFLWTHNADPDDVRKVESLFIQERSRLNPTSERGRLHRLGNGGLFLVRRLAKANALRRNPTSESGQIHGLDNGGSFLVQRLAKANALRRKRFVHWRTQRQQLQGEDLETHTSESCPRGIHPHFTSLGSYRFISSPGRALVAVKFPSPPKVEQQQRKHFECPYCFTLCSCNVFEREDTWKSHIVRDIRPYVCVHENCPTPWQLYDDIDRWSQHLAACHGDETLGLPECPVCCHAVSGPKEMGDHLSKHLEQVALLSLPSLAGSDGESNEADK
ncbi:hypothetical protein PT974_00780 [Cladobotryum mycophilum]|uniref:Oxidoreductase acuF-like C2H2 type zinc-finger domain-containing protein n=1 Tax=Cladobotryum mycophilum TaxID=491253 RepID=A0ABR0T385_9HYPO